MHFLSHAESRGDNRWRLRPQSHLPLRLAGEDRRVEDSECLQSLPHR
jgi:hypothetical protein